MTYINGGWLTYKVVNTIYASQNYREMKNNVTMAAYGEINGGIYPNVT